jgi:hypothetical protein
MKKSKKNAGLDQENGFGSANVHTLQWLVTGTAQCLPAEKSVINMI